MNRIEALRGRTESPPLASKALAFGLLVAAMLAAGLLLTAKPAQAAEFTVNSTADPGTGSCDATECTLREAIEAANVSPGEDTISFDIPGSGVRTISPIGDLPILSPVTIDGYTQPGSSPNTNAQVEQGSNAKPLIELNGSGAGLCCSSDALVVLGGDSTVRGLAINRFLGEGIALRSSNNVIEGNFIGTDAAGTADLGNGLSGVRIDNFPNAAGDNTVGGTSPAARNVISGNEDNGVNIFSSDANNKIQGNYIGTDKGGTADLGNSGNGVDISGTPGNTVGGTETGARNVISGNEDNGVNSRGSEATGNKVEGNHIGTDATGTADLGNSVRGVTIGEGSGNIVGGTSPAARNVISGNGFEGVQIFATNSRVEGNYIGTDKDGTGDLGNSSDGVLLIGFADSTGNTVGGTTPGATNTIAFNGGSGVLVSGGTNAMGNSILANSIFSNKQLGIDLRLSSTTGAGPTPNDPGDPDTGANNLQNFPILASAQRGSLAVKGSLNSTPNTAFRIEFFSNDACDPSGNGEGQTFAGSAEVTTNANGDARINQTFPSNPSGKFITATATNRATNDTSEFSACRTIATEPPPKDKDKKDKKKHKKKNRGPGDGGPGNQPGKNKGGDGRGGKGDGGPRKR